MTSAFRGLASWSLAVMACSMAHGAELADLSRGVGYREVRTAHEQFMAGEPTRAERLEAMRQIVRSSRYGQRGLERIFHDFDGRYALDPRIHGVEKSVRMLASPNVAQQRGYMRELVYAQGFHNDPRFQLVSMNEDRARAWGRTDADIVVRHQETGRQVRLEVKDVSLASQQTNMAKYKLQIDKMAKEARLTGELQFWFNRRPVLPELQEYALQRGVVAVGEVKTGGASRGLDLREARQLVHREALRVDQFRTGLAVASLVYGPWLLIEDAPETLRVIGVAGDWRSMSLNDQLRLGEHASRTLAGAGMTIAGGASFGGRFVPITMQGPLSAVARAGGWGSLAALGAGEVFLVVRYRSGDLSGREFWTTQMVMASTATGTFIGGWVGTVSGSAVPFVPLGALIGGLAGSAAGGYAGKTLAQHSAEWFYERQQGKFDDQFGQAVYTAYGIAFPAK